MQNVDGLCSPVVVAVNSRGNRLLVSEERRSIPRMEKFKSDRSDIGWEKYVDESDIHALKMFQRHGMSKRSYAFSAGLFAD